MNTEQSSVRGSALDGETESALQVEAYSSNVTAKQTLREDSLCKYIAISLTHRSSLRPFPLIYIENFLFVKKGGTRLPQKVLSIGFEVPRTQALWVRTA